MSEKDTPTPTINTAGQNSSGANFDDPLAQERQDSGDPDVIAGRYKVQSKLGQGGMGRVYKALDNLLDRVVAVKLLNRELGVEHFIRRFQLEAKAASQLNHPNILQVLDFGMTKSGEPYMTMEFVVGETMDDYLTRNSKFTLEQAIEVITQICKGMQHAHRHRVVHRDLKPSNIMLISGDPERTACILDFGIAKFETEQQGVLTMTGQIIGSPRCISPEQARGEPLDGRSDVYSLGCVLFEMLSGRPPFSGASSMDVISKHLSERAPGLPAEQFPAEMRAIVEKMLEKKPEDRFSSMTEVMEALGRVPISVEAKEEAGERAIREPFFRSAKRLVARYLPAALLVILLAGLSSFAIWNMLRDPDITKLSESGATILGAAPGESTEESNSTNQAVSEAGLKFVDNHLNYVVDNSMTLTGLTPDQVAVGTRIQTREELARLLKKHPEAVCVRMSGGRLNAAMVDLIQNHKSITRLRFENVVMTPEVMTRIFSIRRLERLKFASLDVDADALVHLKSMTKLESLQFYGMKLTNDHLRYIAEVKSLVYLGLEHTGPFTLKGWKELTRLSNLRTLEVNYTLLQDDGLKTLATLKNLETLSICGNDYIHWDALRSFRDRNTRIAVQDCENLPEEKLPQFSKSMRVRIILPSALKNQLSF